MLVEESSKDVALVRNTSKLIVIVSGERALYTPMFEMKLDHSRLVNSYPNHTNSCVAEHVSDLVLRPSSALQASSSCFQSTHIVKHAVVEDGLFAWPHLELSIFTGIGVGKDVSMQVNSASLVVAQQGVNTTLTDYKLNAALRSFRFGNMAV